MDSTLTTSTNFINFPKSKINPNFTKTLQKPYKKIQFCTKFSCNCTPNPSKKVINQYPVEKTLKFAAKTAVLTVAAALMGMKLGGMPVKAETIQPSLEEIVKDNEVENSPLSKIIQSDAEFVENLRALLHRKLENGEDEEGLKILEKLTEAQPKQIEWKFMSARLLSEMGRIREARDVFEDILEANPLCFEALFENALLMDRSGEKEMAMSRLERALSVAVDEDKAKEARDVRFIMAQLMFLQRNVDEALGFYDELCKEDPNDFRPYFCKGMIYSLMDRNVEAKEQFAKYKELSPRKFEVEGYLRSPLSRMKLFQSGSGN
ncbi:hypothetical protein vseg_004461 [Gypsophila vaccaria]